jgi:hypothetical protein
MAGVGGVEVRRAVARQEAVVAARAVAADVARCRREAIGAARRLGLVFTRGTEGEWHVALHEDGDGDGIRADDVRSGRDPVREPSRPFSARYGAGRPGFLAGLDELTSPPPQQRPLPSLDDPIRFGSGDTVTFTPQGAVSAGTLYLTDGLERQLAVVVHGSAGRVRVWEFHPPTGTWRRP